MLLDYLLRRNVC